MPYPRAAWERAMQVQEVILKALSGEIHWFRAAEILGMHPRSVRRWRERYERFGYHGLIDKRYQRPSQRRVPLADVERVVRLYRERYAGFNVRHFHEIIRGCRSCPITTAAWWPSPMTRPIASCMRRCTPAKVRRR